MMQALTLRVGRNFLGALALSASALAASATTFDFSYVFSTGGNINTAAGSFDGIANGDYIEGVSNISVSYNGNPFAGPLYAYWYDDGSQPTSNPPVVSFLANSNSFIFINCTPNCANSPDPLNYLIVRHLNPNQHASVYIASGSASFAITDDAVNSSWNVVARAVPEPGTYALFGLGLGVMVLRLKRRRG
jgi:hypothetical protein